MTLFVDASAIVAMLAGEADAEQLAEALRDSDDRLWSALSCWEAVRGLHKATDITFRQAQQEVEAIAAATPFRLVEIGEDERRVALHAYETYGRGRHPAKLNMGDCFAYACAKTNRAKLLYKGDDFAHTDLA